MHFELAQVISILVGGVLPLVTGFVSNSTWTGRGRAFTLLALSGVTGVLTNFLASLNGGTAFDWATALTTAFLTFLSGVGAYMGFWKPTGTSDAVLKLRAPRQQVPPQQPPTLT